MRTIRHLETEHLSKETIKMRLKICRDDVSAYYDVITQFLRIRIVTINFRFNRISCQAQKLKIMFCIWEKFQRHAKNKSTSVDLKYLPFFH